jgi:hypothetical protein
MFCKINSYCAHKNKVYVSILLHTHFIERVECIARKPLSSCLWLSAMVVRGWRDVVVVHASAAQFLLISTKSPLSAKMPSSRRQPRACAYHRRPHALLVGAVRLPRSLLVLVCRALSFSSTLGGKNRF